MAEAKAYRISPLYRIQHPRSVTVVNGAGVVLSDEDLVHEEEGTLAHPPRKRTYRAATQEDLKYLFEVEGHPAVEKIEQEGKKQAEQGK
jgi:hypothetical protein